LKGEKPVRIVNRPHAGGPQRLPIVVDEIEMTDVPAGDAARFIETSGRRGADVGRLVRRHGADLEQLEQSMRIVVGHLNGRKAA